MSPNIQIEVPAVLQDDLVRQRRCSDNSKSIRERVKTAHQHQLSRQAKTNNKLTVKEIEKFCILDASSENLLKQAITRLSLSARAYHRILKVARTIADLSGAKSIGNKHIAEAIQYRRLDKN